MLGEGKFLGRVPKWLLPGLAYAVSIGSLIWIFRGVDFGTLLDDFQALHWRWVILGVIADIAVYVFQAWRWNLLLSPVERVPLLRSVRAIYVGLFANEVLPLRPGEVIRSYLQARWSKLPFSVTFASALIERTFDGIWLIVVFFITARFMKLPVWLMDMAKALGIGVVVLAILLGLVMFWKQHAHAACPKTRFGAKLRVLIDDLHLMGNSKSFYMAAFASSFYLLIQVIPIYSLIRAYDLDLMLGPAVVVLVVWRLGTAIPQLPGNLGASQALMVTALKLFGIDKTTATGLSLVTWGVITLPLLLAGFIALATTGFDLGELHHRARSHLRTSPVPTPESQPSKTG